MKWYNQNKTSFLLMLSSLLLLLIFLLFWLRSVYETEKAALQKETEFMFVTDIREIEDSYLNKMLAPLQNIAPENMEVRSSQRIEILGDLSKEKMITIINDKNLPIPSNDSTMNVTVRSTFNGKDRSEVSGSLEMLITIQDNSQGDTAKIFGNDSIDIKSLLYSRFAESIETAKLDLSYDISEVTSGDSATLQEGIHSQYHDLFSDKSYALQVENYEGLLLKKIIPQILFSLLLFSCIAMAFFMVFQNLQKQRRLTELKNDFISNITHELKTPITTVGVAIEALNNFDALQNKERTKEYLDISKHELNRLSILVDKVLKMSLFEKGEPELKLEMIDLRVLTEEILNSMKLQFDKFAAQVQFEPLGDQFWVKGDRVHLTSVLYNLIENALKYSPQNPIINIGLNNTLKGLEMTIIDQGLGIEPQYKDQIFDKFFRVPTGDEHNIKGYGLGLSYVASVIQKHHGTIEVESTLGKGTSFTILFPFVSTSG